MHAHVCAHIEFIVYEIFIYTNLHALILRQFVLFVHQTLSDLRFASDPKCKSEMMTHHPSEINSCIVSLLGVIHALHMLNSCIVSLLAVICALQMSNSCIISLFAVIRVLQMSNYHVVSLLAVICALQMTN